MATNLVFSFLPAPDVATAYDFGALTLAGAGGIALPDGATSITNAGGTNLAAVGGYVVPSTNGVTSGTVVFNNSDEWVITALADTYSARTMTEVITLVDLGATLSGKTVLLRPGTYAAHTAWTNKQRFYTSQVVFDAHDATNKPVFNGYWEFAANVPADTLGNTTLRNIKFDMSNNQMTTGVRIGVIGSSVKFANIHIENCEFIGNLPNWYDGYIPPSESASINCSGYVTNFSVKDCIAQRIVNFIGYFAGTNIEIERNVATLMWGDFMRFGVVGKNIDGTVPDTSNVLIADNVAYDFIGNYAAYRHMDFIQTFDRNFGGQLGGGEITDVEVLRNRMFFGPNVQIPASNGSENECQFMLMQDLVDDGDFYRRFTIRGNVTEQNSVHGITFERVCVDSVIEGNTLVGSRRARDAGVSLTPPLIRGTYVDCTIRQNVSGGVDIYAETNGLLTSPSGNTVEDNYSTGSIDFSNDTGLLELFQGPTFKPDTPTELINQLRMKANGPLDADNSGGPTVGDIGALGTTTSNGIADFVNRTINTALIG
jgi:hypothetical protein